MKDLTWLPTLVSGSCFCLQNSKISIQSEYWQVQYTLPFELTWRDESFDFEVDFEADEGFDHGNMLGTWWLEIKSETKKDVADRMPATGSIL
jgi:hypothetical protein